MLKDFTGKMDIVNGQIENLKKYMETLKSTKEKP